MTTLILQILYVLTSQQGKIVLHTEDDYWVSSLKNKLTMEYYP